MKILIIEPFMSGSHASWANGLKKHSRHDVEILSLPGRHWKWRMHGGAITLARKFRDYLQTHTAPDLIIATDMLDLPTFMGLCRRELHSIPVALYFHENQLSYPWSPQDRDVIKGRDFHYGFINWVSAYSADAVYFNSRYNLDSFYDGVEQMLKAMPDNRHFQQVAETRDRSAVLPLGIELEDLYVPLSSKEFSYPVILWNHRWEYDKDPDGLFNALTKLQEDGITFKLIVCGEAYERYPAIFDEVEDRFQHELIHFGYAESRAEYCNLLHQANLIPVTNKQEFFGASVMEAIAAGCFPLLPDALAYPEHIPDSLKKIVLYRSDEQLHEKLTDLSASLGEQSDIQAVLQQIAMKYNWKGLIDTYDDTFEDAVKLP